MGSLVWSKCFVHLFHSSNQETWIAWMRGNHLFVLGHCTQWHNATPDANHDPPRQPAIAHPQGQHKFQCAKSFLADPLVYSQPLTRFPAFRHWPWVQQNVSWRQACYPCFLFGICADQSWWGPIPPQSPATGYEKLPWAIALMNKARNLCGTMPWLSFPEMIRSNLLRTSNLKGPYGMHGITRNKWPQVILKRQKESGNCRRWFCRSRLQDIEASCTFTFCSQPGLAFNVVGQQTCATVDYSTCFIIFHDSTNEKRAKSVMDWWFESPWARVPFSKPHGGTPTRHRGRQFPCISWRQRSLEVWCKSLQVDLATITVLPVDVIIKIEYH